MIPRLIVFIDKDNRLLGPSAEVVLRSRIEGRNLEGITIVSASVNLLGFVTRDKEMDRVLSRDSLSIKGIVNPLTGNLVQSADWIVCMDEEGKQDRIVTMSTDSQKKVMDFPTKKTLDKLTGKDIPDCELIYQEIKKGCEVLLERITRECRRVSSK